MKIRGYEETILLINLKLQDIYIYHIIYTTHLNKETLIDYSASFADLR